MNQDFNTWINTEKEYWESQDYKVNEIPNGIEVEGDNPLQVLWEPTLYDLFQQTFQIKNNLFVYSLRSKTVQYYIDFIFNNLYIRFNFVQTSSNTIRYAVRCSTKSFFDMTSKFNDLDSSTIRSILDYLQLSLELITHFPTFRIKLAIKELRLLTPSENFCDFEEYCLQNTI